MVRLCLEAIVVEERSELLVCAMGTAARGAPCLGLLLLWCDLPRTNSRATSTAMQSRSFDSRAPPGAYAAAAFLPHRASRLNGSPHVRVLRSFLWVDCLFRGGYLPEM